MSCHQSSRQAQNTSKVRTLRGRVCSALAELSRGIPLVIHVASRGGKEGAGTQAGEKRLHRWLGESFTPSSASSTP